MHDSKEAEYPAEPPHVLHAAVAEPEGDEETSRSRTRVDQQAAQREESGANHRRTDTCASRLGELFPDGERRPGVQQDGRLCDQELAPLAIPAGGAKADEAGSIPPR